MIESKQTQISNMGTRHRSIDFSLCFIQTNEQSFFATFDVIAIQITDSNVNETPDSRKKIMSQQ